MTRPHEHRTVPRLTVTCEAIASSAICLSGGQFHGWIGFQAPENRRGALLNDTAIIAFVSENGRPRRQSRSISRLPSSRPDCRQPKESGPEIEFYEDVPIDELPSKLQAVVFFIVRELLFNACRHSHSKRLFVELTLDGNVLHIRVRDWGVGFDPDSTPSGHFGLNGIRRRVKLLGGKAIRRGGLTMMDYISGIFWELAKWLAGKTKYTKKSKRP